MLASTVPDPIALGNEGLDSGTTHGSQSAKHKKMGRNVRPISSTSLNANNSDGDAKLAARIKRGLAFRWLAVDIVG